MHIKPWYRKPQNIVEKKILKIYINGEIYYVNGLKDLTLPRCQFFQNCLIYLT